jgi:chromosome segregation protein
MKMQGKAQWPSSRDRDAAELEIEDLRQEIKKLGNVNLDAIEEESLLEERNVDLIKQVDDIDNAVSQLATAHHAP